ncbi:LysE/ArgO family amino acid transporter [Pseudolysinimonas yzui]|uniref:Amino acid transporter n=1 Tax=Pseudolysinimonas yzui TaxID=2708254 RepID=A0A8J3M0H6_9MICO|nr:LysE/ArgO family amino acid transporter [Pseudolysinimonas yzui]GHF13992.1 amino acid transporter [Pseudolysinimonas yzui]
MTAALLAAVAGLGLGLSLIIAIGAQNAFVLRQGLRREHVLAVVVICAVSDAVLIIVGVAGGGVLFTALPWLVEIIRWVGAAFLITYGVLAAVRALRRPKPDADGLRAERGAGATSLAVAITTCLALTWLNPHVYLDTVLLLGSVGSTHGDERWWFAVGATLGSILWFTSLGFGARLLAPLFARPLAWRILDGIIAVVMIAIALSLVLVR